MTKKGEAVIEVKQVANTLSWSWLQVHGLNNILSVPISLRGRDALLTGLGPAAVIPAIQGTMRHGVEGP